MRIYLRLDQYLDTQELALAQLARDIDVSEAQLKHALEKEPKQVSRDVLEKVCDYLVKNHLADPLDLPGALFGIAPENFWNLLCERHRITMCMGTRSFESAKDQVVIAADSILQANVTVRMTEESSAGHGRPRTGTGKTRKYKPQQIIDPHLVPAWPKETPRQTKEVIREASELYETFRMGKRSRALICFGSIKSNPVIEFVLTNSFRGAQPFVSQDTMSEAARRACPFVLIYRPWDPKPASVCGGKQLAKTSRKSAAGIHFETPDGKWQCAEWTEDTSDAALVFYHYDKSDNRLEMVLGGFSGRGTRCLAELFRNDEVQKFWPPEISNEKMELGAFVVRFELEPADDSVAVPARRAPRIKNYQVHRLQGEVLQRRIAG